MKSLTDCFYGVFADLRGSLGVGDDAAQNLKNIIDISDKLTSCVYRVREP
jgi:hypothetical protein